MSVTYLYVFTFLLEHQLWRNSSQGSMLPHVCNKLDAQQQPPHTHTHWMKPGHGDGHQAAGCARYSCPTCGGGAVNGACSARQDPCARGKDVLKGVNGTIFAYGQTGHRLNGRMFVQKHALQSKLNSCLIWTEQELWEKLVCHRWGGGGGRGLLFWHSGKTKGPRKNPIDAESLLKWVPSFPPKGVNRIAEGLH